MWSTVVRLSDLWGQHFDKGTCLYQGPDEDKSFVEAFAPALVIPCSTTVGHLKSFLWTSVWTIVLKFVWIKFVFSVGMYSSHPQLLRSEKLCLSRFVLHYVYNVAGMHELPTPNHYGVKWPNFRKAREVWTKTVWEFSFLVEATPCELFDPSRTPYHVAHQPNWF